MMVDSRGRATTYKRLLTIIYSLVASPMTPKYETLNNLEWPFLPYILFLRREP